MTAPVERRGARGSALPHESARGHVTGAARYADDLPEPVGMLFAAPVLSPVAHGRNLKLQTDAARTLPGVHAVVTAADIPGARHFPTQAADEPVLAADAVAHCGQVVALVVAASMQQARRAARAVGVTCDPLPAVVTLEAAAAAGEAVVPPVTLRRGDPENALAAAPHRISRTLRVGGQEHYYLETQIAVASPVEDGGCDVVSSSQHPAEVQHWVAHVLDVPAHKVRVTCRRMGGGFGGKETQAGHVAVWAALAARVTGRPVKVRLDRADDFVITGKRHDFGYAVDAGYDDDGRVTALSVTLSSRCGFSADLSGPVNDRAVFHVDNAYHLPHVEIVSHRLRSHTQSATAFRGFGGPQGMLAIETVLGDIARATGRDALDVRLANLYASPDRDTTPYGMTVDAAMLGALVTDLVARSEYRSRRAAIRTWNARSPHLKRGLAITPVKFGISFTATFFNQAGALVLVYTDGSVQVNHGGTEMGQGLHTKVRQIVADALGVPVARVQPTESDTARVPNASATAASSGTDLNGKAAERAALEIRTRIATMIAERDGCSAEAVVFEDGWIASPRSRTRWEDEVQAAYRARIQLWSDGFYRTPKIHYDKATLSGRPFFYFAHGAACTEVVIDTRTGEMRVLAVDILHDAGRSLNPAIDRGQIEGGFVQGMGWLTTEELVWDAAGRLRTTGASTYKIPSAGDVPEHFRVWLWDRPNAEDTVYASKAVGEPPFMLALSVYEAIRDAIGAVDPTGTQPVAIDPPCTPERILDALGRCVARQQRPA